MLIKTISKRLTQSGSYKILQHFIDIGFSKAKHYLVDYPRTLIAVMVSLILASGILAFTVMRPKKVTPLPDLSSVVLHHKNEVFKDNIGSLKEIIEMQAIISYLLEKDSLDRQDSLLFQQTTQRMEQIEKKLGKQTP